MTSDLDILRTASLLIRKHGADAEMAAAMKADEMLTAGDVEGERVWLRVIKAIRELQDTTRPALLN